MKKQNLLIIVSLFSLQSLQAQNARMSWADAKSQAYGYGQTGWEKTKEGLQWIKEHPTDAAALGLLVGMYVVGLAATGGIVAADVISRKRLKQSNVPKKLEEAKTIRSALLDKIPVFASHTKDPALSAFFNSFYGESDHSDQYYSVTDLKYFNFDVGNNQVSKKNNVETSKGLSVIGAAIISQKEEGKEERIEELLSHGVKLTDDDKKLLALYNWEKNIPERKGIHEALRTGVKEELQPKMTEEQIQQIQEGEINPIHFLPPETRELIYEQMIEPLEIPEE